MRQPLLAACLFLLGSFAPAAPAIAQESGSNTDYLLILVPGLSELLAGSIQLGPSQSTSSNGCTLMSAEDGIITCLLSDSCNSGQPVTCGISFTGPSGLSVEDVAVLAPLSAGNGENGGNGGNNEGPSRIAVVTSKAGILTALRSTPSSSQ